MAFGIDDAIAAGLKIIDKFIPDPELKAKMQRELEVDGKDLKLANLQADNVEAQEISKRWQADLASDSALAKNIRPAVLIFLLAAYFFFALMSMFGYETRGAYVELENVWGEVDDSQSVMWTDVLANPVTSIEVIDCFGSNCIGEVAMAGVYDIKYRYRPTSDWTPVDDTQDTNWTKIAA